MHPTFFSKKYWNSSQKLCKRPSLNFFIVQGTSSRQAPKTIRSWLLVKWAWQEREADVTLWQGPRKNIKSFFSQRGANLKDGWILGNPDILLPPMSVSLPAKVGQQIEWICRLTDTGWALQNNPDNTQEGSSFRGISKFQCCGLVQCRQSSKGHFRTVFQWKMTHTTVGWRSDWGWESHSCLLPSKKTRATTD